MTAAGADAVEVTAQPQLGGAPLCYAAQARIPRIPPSAVWKALDLEGRSQGVARLDPLRNFSLLLQKKSQIARGAGMRWSPGCSFLKLPCGFSQGWLLRPKGNVL